MEIQGYNMPDDMGEVEDLIHGAAAIERWLLADIEKYKN